jgi:hypothetical protein
MNKMLKRHTHCPVQVVAGPFGPHAAKLVCTRHNKVMQWLSKQAVEQLKELPNGTNTITVL